VSRVSLLDVNVLVALFDPDHVHHDPAHVWFAANRNSGWATCPITENGLVRILSNSAYSGVHEAPHAIRHRLSVLCTNGGYEFWPDELSLRDRSVFALRPGVSHRQLTDVYLLGLAKHHGGRLATFDRRIPLAAVAGAAPGDVEVLPS
jgi:toxin-antitoxin system PIN domain toxin